MDGLMVCQDIQIPLLMIWSATIQDDQKLGLLTLGEFALLMLVLVLF